MVKFVNEGLHEVKIKSFVLTDKPCLVWNLEIVGGTGKENTFAKFSNFKSDFAWKTLCNEFETHFDRRIDKANILGSVQGLEGEVMWVNVSHKTTQSAEGDRLQNVVIERRGSTPIKIPDKPLGVDERLVSILERIQESLSSIGGQVDTLISLVRPIVDGVEPLDS